MTRDTWHREARGLYYRLRSDGSRAWAVYANGRRTRIEGPEDSRPPGYRSPTKVKPPEERFWAKVAAADGNGCRLWTASTMKGGYGQFCPRRGSVSGAHRFAWGLENGPVPTGYELHHECRNPACVSVEHLRLVTPAEHAGLHGKKRNDPLTQTEHIVTVVDDK